MILHAKTGMDLKDFLASVEDDFLPPAVKEQYQHNGIFLGFLSSLNNKKPIFLIGYNVKINLLKYHRKN